MLDTPHDTTVTTTKDQKPALRTLIRELPAILSGRASDVQGIAQGFRTRIGFAILSLVGPNFDELGRGMPGADGTRWPPLTKAYLAYGRRFGPGEKADLKKQAGVTKAHRFAPGDKKGLLTKEQLQLWRRTYADRLAWYMMRESNNSAKAHAAAVAWIVVKAAGAKTMLEVYGNRTVQILVDTGRGRQSLQPGTIYERGPDASYSGPGGKGGGEQVFEHQPDGIIVGTNVKYMGHHHDAKNQKRRRRLWPETFPKEWWDQILGVAMSGLLRIGELYHGGKGTIVR